MRIIGLYSLDSLGPAVDVLMGGGRCYFKPKSDETSCRSDDTNLISFAQEHGYYVMQNRSAFDNLEGGKGDIPLPFLGLFNDGECHDIVLITS